MTRLSAKSPSIVAKTCSFRLDWLCKKGCVCLSDFRIECDADDS
jgi:hypothetical protein